MAFTYVTITHSYSEPDEAPAVGVVEFTPVAAMRNESTVVSAPVKATLTAGGALSQRLAANTDLDTTPTGTTYRVVEKLVGQPELTYYIQIPHDEGSAIDIRSLAGWQGGVNPGGGSGSVNSINGEGPDGSGNVVVSASDVGAQPADADLTGLAALDDGVPVRTGGVWTVASGTPDGTKFLRDDGSWRTVPGSGGGGDVTSVNGQTGVVVLDADDLADGSTRVQMTTAERTKLGGVATGATANSSDAQLRDRSTHTGTQTSGTISDFGEAAQDAAAALFTSGAHTGLTATYVDGSNRIDLAVTGGGSSTTVTQTTQTGTAYTLGLGDAGTVVERNNASANTTTVPPNSSVAFPVGAYLSVRQVGAGQTTLVGGTGVTLQSRGGALKLAGQWAEATLTKRGTNEWVVSGEVTP